MDDRFNLSRFIEAQAGVYDEVVAELKAGDKRTHWMWFVFPQIAGLGSSGMARRYAIQSMDEAVAYGEHPLLGARLIECTLIMNSIEGKSALEILGSPDDMKFRSCLTLFKRALPDAAEFQEALKKYFDSEEDPRTLSLLGLRAQNN